MRRSLRDLLSEQNNNELREEKGDNSGFVLGAIEAVDEVTDQANDEDDNDNDETDRKG